jgi:hypothetical protein
MGSATNQRGSRWEFVAYGLLWGALRILYVFANRICRTGGASGMDLSHLWWTFVILYYVIDVIMLTILTVLWRRHIGNGVVSKVSFWRDVSEIVPFLFIFHLAILVFEYPVAVRLEGSGVGKLEVIVGTGALLTVSGALFRSLEITSGPILSQEHATHTKSLSE